MNSSKQFCLEVALYIAKTEEIQQKAAEIAQKLKAVIPDPELADEAVPPEVSSPEAPQGRSQTSKVANAHSGVSTEDHPQLQYEQVLILIWN